MTRTIIAGDLHQTYEGTNVDAVRRFRELLDRDPPDRLVLGGDIYEMWRRDLFGVAWSNTEFTSLVESLQDRGVEVVYLAGNHDDWPLKHMTHRDDYLADQQLDYAFESGGEQFFVTHGHKYEPAYNALTNDLLATADDRLGMLASAIWDARPQLPVPDPVEGSLALAAGPAYSYLDPEALADQPVRQMPILAGIRRESGNGWGIFGHTHTPYVDSGEKIANWGSMTGDQSSYIEVEDGEVNLLEV